MPLPTADHAPRGEMFLHLVLEAGGKAKGEAQAAGHEDDIEVLAWRWGASARTALGSGAPTARRSYKELTVVKALDSASTALLTAIKKNDEVGEALLTMRKRGAEPLAFFTLALKGARVAAIDYSADAAGHVDEVLTLTFASVKATYHPQLADGTLGAAHSFDDTL